MAAKVHWETEGVRYAYSGKTTDEDLRSSREEVYSNPAFAKLRYQIVDATNVDNLLITAECMQELAATDVRVGHQNPDLRVCIVAPRDVLYGMARMYGSLADDSPWALGIFETLEEARAWVAD